MLKNSIVENEDYLPTERDEGSGNKYDNSICDASLAIMDETINDELDQSIDSPGRALSSPKRVPIAANPDKPRLHNDNG